MLFRPVVLAAFEDELEKMAAGWTLPPIATNEEVRKNTLKFLAVPVIGALLGAGGSAANTALVKPPGKTKAKAVLKDALGGAIAGGLVGALGARRGLSYYKSVLRNAKQAVNEVNEGRDLYFGHLTGNSIIPHPGRPF